MKTNELKVEHVKMEDSEWTKVEPNQIPAYKFEKAGDTFIGTYVKFRSNVGPNGSMLYSVKDEAGNDFVIWGCDVLDGRMESIKPGTVIKIVYKGKTKSQKSNREYNDYEVYAHSA